MPNILIIDDDAHINDIVSKALKAEGYNVTSAYSGTEALLLLSHNKPDLILLDLMLPGLSGEELLPQIKDIPVIVVSAKADVTDKVELLVGGAADYITKPFDMKELLARIMVQLRKNENYADKSLLTYREITLDTDKHTVSANGSEQKLTRTEFAIMKLLIRDPEQVVAKLTILDRISLDTPDCTEDSLKSHIYNLRKKLKALTGKEYISSVWGIGFMLNEKS
ncbi:response regulator transcription factor [Ruminococcus sp. XPD3002]|uniref:response regulator transcription factor n=1 Tax=Ruminococcus sp. XPD3002 TaxID=1452269 RepID=UPI00091D5619|nr:DNA-binding response regulator, OmpR family, contains REC and winged-helix (wHTH) domain [Ruminococcus flavefaciens]